MSAEEAVGSYSRDNAQSTVSDSHRTDLYRDDPALTPVVKSVIVNASYRLQRMYRARQAKEKNMSNTEAISADLPQVQFINKVVQLPAVASAWGYAANFYEKAKGSSSLVEKTLSTAEQTAKVMVTQVLPISTHFKGPIEMVDNIACKGLEQIEQKLPVITKPPEEIISTTKEYVSSTLVPVQEFGNSQVQKLKSTAQVVGQYGYSTANVVLSNPVGKMALDGVDAILGVAEGYVDRYLPSSETGKKEMPLPDNLEPPAKIAYSVRRAMKISQKTYKGALEKLTVAQDTAKALTRQIDLVQLAQSLSPTVLKEQAQTLWETLLRDDIPDNDKALAAASALAKRLVGVYSSAYTTIRGAPSYVQAGLNESLKQAVVVYTQVMKATKMEAVSDALIAQMKGTLQIFQQQVDHLLSVFSTWLDATSRPPKSQPKSEENGVNNQPRQHFDKLD